MLTALADGTASVRFRDRALRGDDLAAAVGAVSRQVSGAGMVAVWAEPRIETLLAVAGALRAGATVVPVNPASTPPELDHVLVDSRADLLAAPPDVGLPTSSRRLDVLRVRAEARADLPVDAADVDDPALVMYTSGTSGPPKGVVHTRRGIAANLDALADAWAWSPDDVLGHALPLFHVHGLVLGGLGPLRIGSELRHPGRFEPATFATTGASMYFAVPTMWARWAAAAASGQAPNLDHARLLVSGSAPLPEPVFCDVLALTGRRLVQRYGLTETLIVTAVRADDRPGPETVGRPVPGVEVMVADPGREGLGEVLVRGPSLLSGYLGDPQPAVDDVGWFHTGDLGWIDRTGELRLAGRADTDLIKSGGYRIGAGEVEDALLACPGVVEAAVTGVPDVDLGQRVVAWVVTRTPVSSEELAELLAGRLAAHKRPREFHFLDRLPRTALGKVRKRELGPAQNGGQGTAGHSSPGSG